MAVTKKATAKKVEEKAEVQYGLQVFGVVRVFQKTKKVKVKGKDTPITEYWLNISKKSEAGEYVNKSISVFFGKDADHPENTGLIDIGKAWFFITGNEGYERISLFVDEFEVVDEE